MSLTDLSRHQTSAVDSKQFPKIREDDVLDEATSEILIESEQRLRLAIETGDIGLWVWDPRKPSNSKKWSNRLKEIFGFLPEVKVTHEMFLKLIHPEDRDRVERQIQEALQGVNGGEYDTEYRMIRVDDGSTRWITARGQVFSNDEGEAVRFIGTVMDITEKKLGEELLNSQNSYLEERIAERTADLEKTNRELRKEIEERKRIESEWKKAEAALSASEHLARGQLVGLTRTLDALATETNPSKLLLHVFSALTQQLEAHGCSVWCLDEVSGLMNFEAAFEDHKLKAKTDPEIAAISPQLPIESVYPWPEVFRTGKAYVVEDISQAPEFPWQSHLISQGIHTILVVPMTIAGRVAGVIGVRFGQKRLFRAEEVELAQAMSNQAMLAIQLSRLSEISRQSAVVAERNRMARDIHDTLAQGFTGIIMQLEAAEAASVRADMSGLVSHVGKASALARSSLGEARRSVRALRPRSLRDGTLCMALEDSLKRMADGSNLQMEFHLEGEERPIAPECEEELLRIAQESLTNTIKHAKARHFRMTLKLAAESIQLQMVDDGLGFDPKLEHDGYGLIGMKERVDGMGGQFILRSKPEQGTEIIVILNFKPKEGL